MKRVKGCINEGCIANQGKNNFKDADDYCSKCGNMLYHVCKECYTQLPDDAAKYCERCLAKKQDRKDHMKDNALKTGGAIGAIGISAISIGAKVFKAVTKQK